MFWIKNSYSRYLSWNAAHVFRSEEGTKKGLSLIDYDVKSLNLMKKII